MKTTTQLKTLLSGLVLCLLLGFSHQSAFGQFLGTYYMDSVNACVNVQHDGFVGWNQPAGSYATGDSIDFFIDWGDGNNNTYPDVQMYVSSSAFASTSASHTYTTPGVFYINVTATDELSNVFTYTDSIIVDTNCGIIYGYVVLDNGDNVYGAGDITASGVPVILTTNLANHGANTGIYGNYEISNIDQAATTYQVEIDPAWLTANGFTVISPVGGNYTFTTPPVGSNIPYHQFLLDCGVSYNDASVSGFGWGFRPGLATGYTWIDLSSFTCDGTPGDINLTVTFDPMLTVTSSGFTGYSVVGNTLTATVNNLSGWNMSDIHFMVPPGTPALTPLVFDLDINVTNYTDNYLTNNHYVINSEVRNSWDPNDKSTNVASTIDAAVTDEIYYNVRFQNMGNDYAYDIHIVDTIDSQLDLSTFRLVSMSHPGSYSLDPVTRIVVFNFPNIMLPWESMSDPLSQGFVRYSIKENPGLPVGSELNNTAYIYFDTNDPVITNTTSNINASVGIEEENTNPLVIYPQPASDVVYIGGMNTNDITSIHIMDNNGRVIQTMNGNQVNEGISVSTLSSGMYFVTVVTNNGPFTKKMCVKR